MPTYANDKFAILWEKIEKRYKDETGEELYPRQHAAFVTYLRKFPEINKKLPKSGKGDQEGHAIYLAVKDIGKPTDIVLGNKYYEALKLYGEGVPHTPFRDYFNHLKNFYIRPGNLNNDNISLQDLYIEPEIVTDYKSNYNGKLLIDIVVKWLKEEILLSHDYKKVIVLLGDPGQGKTSFCYRLLHHIAEFETRPIYFFRLRYLFDIENFYKDPFSSIINHIKTFGYNQDENIKKEIPITEENFKDSILILDGLDELEKINNIDKDALCLRLSIMTNAIFSPHRLIITSRKEVNIHILNQKDITCWFISELSKNDQKVWLKKYNKLNNDSYVLSTEQLDFLNEDKSPTSPLMRQPILLHILAQLNIRPDVSYNLSKVYDELFTRLLNRYWSSQYNIEDPHPVLNKFIYTPQQLRSIVQRIGFEMYRRDTTYLSHNEIPISIIKQLGFADDKQLEALKTLLIAFYFNYRIIENEFRVRQYAIEFLHKSFGEYLAAEAIWHEINEIFSDKEKTPEHILERLIELFSTNDYLSDSISLYIYQIIVNERSIFKEITKRQIELGNKMFFYLEKLINYDFFYSKEPQYSVISKALKTFFGFLNIFIRVSAPPPRLQSNNHIHRRFYQLLRLVTQEKNNLILKSSILTHGDLSRMNFNNSFIDNSKLDNANLNYSTFCKSKLLGSDFSNSECINTDFSYADLQECIFKDSDLRYSIFNNANLSNSDMRFTRLNEAKLIGATLNYADLTGSNLNEADLQSAKLEFATLNDTKLRYAFLNNARMNNVKLNNADLSEANLERTYLLGAQLDNTNLSSANLRKAILNGIDFKTVNLESADLTDANLSDSFGLTLEKLSRVKSLKNCIGLSPEISADLKNKFPYLF